MSLKAKVKKILMGEFSTEQLWKIRENALKRSGWAGAVSRMRYGRIVNQYGAFIPLSTQIDGVPTFPHGIHGVFMSGGSKIGTGCVIFHQVTIGSNTLKDSKGFGAPVIGDNVYIGAGAKIVGGVKVGNNVRIGANCVVTVDIPSNCTVVAGKHIIIQKDKTQDNHFVEYRKNSSA